MNEALSLRPHPRNPRSRERWLTGEDDGHAYDVRVPMRIRSIADALEWLRPAGVPADALRQGEFYFLPARDPHVEYCYHAAEDIHSYYADGRIVYRRGTEHGSDEFTEAGSVYRYRLTYDQFSATHAADHCVRVDKRGDVAFRGRRRMRTHEFRARPRYFIWGGVTHPEHGRLDLGPGWYEVVPNRAHGPFPVAGRDRGID